MPFRAVAVLSQPHSATIAFTTLWRVASAWPIVCTVTHTVLVQVHARMHKRAFQKTAAYSISRVRPCADPVLALL